ncbi:hypothetical protein M5K25_000133 [Dendrobium thyrsiflorum]|uniref:Uncharacterized protein n=1 Tax=Dendrobium thyrsiflorum TaxID=117978 RepID=A0ABD0VT35_DENTH
MEKTSPLELPSASLLSPHLFSPRILYGLGSNFGRLLQIDIDIDVGSRPSIRTTLPPAENRSLFLRQRTASSFSNLSAKAENLCPFSPLPSEGREPDTMLTYFTRNPPEMMGKNLKKKRRSSLWATLPSRCSTKKLHQQEHTAINEHDPLSAGGQSRQGCSICHRRIYPQLAFKVSVELKFEHHSHEGKSFLSHLLSFLIVRRFRGNPSHLLLSPECQQAHLAEKSKIHERPDAYSCEKALHFVSSLSVQTAWEQ